MCFIFLSRPYKYRTWHSSNSYSNSLSLMNVSQMLFSFSNHLIPTWQWKVFLFNLTVATSKFLMATERRFTLGKDVEAIIHPTRFWKWQFKNHKTSQLKCYLATIWAMRALVMESLSMALNQVMVMGDFSSLFNALVKKTHGSLM